MVKERYGPTSVAVIVTVLNEASSIGGLLESLCRQTRAPDKVIVVDGGSTDGTVEVMAAFTGQLPLRVMIDPGCSISAGRNLAIAAATSEVIAATDAGVLLDTHWLEELTRPFEAEEMRPDVVSGFFASDPRSAFEAALGATTIPTQDDIVPERFLPSSRSVAFTKAAWEAVGGYPEWLDYCEDLVFDLQLRDAGFRFVWAPKAIARFRPRPSLSAFFRQYYRYARGDGKADLWRARHAVRYGAYAALLLALASRTTSPWAWLPLAAGSAAYLRRPVARLIPFLPSLTVAQRLKAVLYLPVIRLAGDLAKMAGYPAGRRWRRPRG